MIVVCCDDQTKHTNAQLFKIAFFVTADGTYVYNWMFKRDNYLNTIPKRVIFNVVWADTLWFPS